jgi:Fe-S cluster biosynthesis and repair protein YggX
MKSRLVHQWRDWLLKYTGGDEYELINKAKLSVHKITAQNFMEAETKSQLFIRNSTKAQK